MHRGSIRGCRRRRGFTLVEVLLSLAILAIVGTMIATMLYALSAAARSGNDTRRATMKRQVAAARLGALTRNAVMVLDRGEHYLVLWKGDADDNRQPNLSELLRLEWDTQKREVWCYQAPANLSGGADTQYALGDDFGPITAALAGSSSFPGVKTLAAVGGWDTALDAADPHDARLVRLRVTIEHDDGPDVASIVSALRPRPD